jgi:ribonuclease Z
MDFDLTILGSNSAVPAFGRHPTSQVLRYKTSKYLIDCGEGTQFQLSRFKVKRGTINNIFISHLHGDHYFGLVGLVNSFRLNGRKEPLNIFGPPQLLDIIKIQVKIDDEQFGYPVTFYPLTFGVSEKIFEDDNLEVFTIPMEHKIDCNGFLFKEKPRPRKIISDKIREHQISHEYIEFIRKGANFQKEDGTIVPNNELTEDPAPSVSYAFCSDTLYTENFLQLIDGVDLLYHEATFTNDSADKAKERFHSTAAEAATIAVKANVKKLLIGHFSARYADLQPLLEEAKSIFPNTQLATEGEIFQVGE